MGEGTGESRQRQHKEWLRACKNASTEPVWRLCVDAHLGGGVGVRVAMPREHDHVLKKRAPRAVALAPVHANVVPVAAVAGFRRPGQELLHGCPVAALAVEPQDARPRRAGVCGCVSGAGAQERGAVGQAGGRHTADGA